VASPETLKARLTGSGKAVAKNRFWSLEMRTFFTIAFGLIRPAAAGFVLKNVLLVQWLDAPRAAAHS